MGFTCVNCKQIFSRIEYINHTTVCCDVGGDNSRPTSPNNVIEPPQTNPEVFCEVPDTNKKNEQSEALFMVINLDDDQLLDIAMDDNEDFGQMNVIFNPDKIDNPAISSNPVQDVDKGTGEICYNFEEHIAEIVVDDNHRSRRELFIDVECSEEAIQVDDPPAAADVENTIPTTLEDGQEIHEATADEGNHHKGFTKKGQPRKRSAPTVKKSKLEKSREKHLIKRPCNGDKCKHKCIEKINYQRRQIIHEQFWSLKNNERQVFILSNVIRMNKATTTVLDGSRRNKTFIYTLTNDDGERVKVCKTFFLATLGYEKKNDRAIFNILNQPISSITPKSDMRGKHPPHNRVDKDIVREHIMTFNPCVHHYRSEHAPNRLYLPTDINVRTMHTDFLQKNPHLNYSYDLYRSVVVSDMNISFTKLGHEECERCELFMKHNDEHAKDPEQYAALCSTCEAHLQHRIKYNEARKQYQNSVSTDKTEEYGLNKTVVYSMDLQKVIMLPIMDEFKECIFTKRIVVLNESFVPIGKEQPAEIKPIACIWHECISGRKKEDICSAIHKFIISNRDAKKIILWMDNCASQNKNWSLFSHMVWLINSQEISATHIEFNYLEPGHTYMSVDSFHHQVAKQLKLKGKVYDFTDFTDAVSKSNSGNVTICSLESSDFFLEFNHASVTKVNKTNPRPYLANMVQVLFKRGSMNLKYKTSFTGDETELDFLKVALIKKQHIPTPPKRDSPRGICPAKKSDIMNRLLPLVPENRKDFWRNIPDSNVPDLISDIDV